MTTIGSPAMTQAQADALSSTPKFVSSDIMTVQDVLSTYPAGVAHRGRYVRVSNLYGYIDGVMRCGMDSDTGLYFWQPTTPEYGRSIPMTANMTLLRLLSPVSVNLTGSIALGITRNVTIDLANARPGEIIEIKAGLTSLLGNLNVLGTGLGSGVAVLLGAYQKYVVDASSGSLQLVRLV